MQHKYFFYFLILLQITKDLIQIIFIKTFFRKYRKEFLNYFYTSVQ